MRSPEIPAAQNAPTRLPALHPTIRSGWMPRASKAPHADMGNPWRSPHPARQPAGDACLNGPGRPVGRQGLRLRAWLCPASAVCVTRRRRISGGFIDALSRPVRQAFSSALAESRPRRRHRLRPDQAVDFLVENDDLAGSPVGRPRVIGRTGSGEAMPDHRQPDPGTWAQSAPVLRRWHD